MGYGRHELKYAKPIADALAENAQFRRWLLSRTKFHDVALEARLLHEEIISRRSRGTKYWWRSHYSEVCRCVGCRGQETDLLAIFETSSGDRFALHVEVKHPGDRFDDKKEQAAAYPVRARCWVNNPPKSVLPHRDATTMVLFGEAKRSQFDRHLAHFESQVSWEEIEAAFPAVGVCDTAR
jgi:hypothetical protein